MVLVGAWLDSLWGKQRVWEMMCHLPITMNASNGGPWAELAGKFDRKGELLRVVGTFGRTKFQLS